jgi:4-amino-4-deoxy-L-arabinose transferase-like glycosyltransferase
MDERPARWWRSSALTGWVLVVALGQLALLVATSTRYGYHRDEMYFIVAGGHPAFGYPDQPPLVPLLTWTMNWLAPGSLLVLRLPSAFAAVATTVLAACIAREAGGRRAAQTIAALCAASSGFALATGHFVTTTTFDLLSTSAVCWLLVRAVATRSSRTLLAAGIVAGVGCEAKPQVALVAVVAICSLALVGPRWVIRSRWLVIGALAGAALAAPYIIWQSLHGWPQITVAQNIAGTAESGRVGFLPFQLVMVSPLLVPVWVMGLVVPFRREALRPFRFVSLTYGLLAVVYLVGDGKAYYLASLYPALLGLGAVPVADWLTRGRRVRRTAFAAAIAISIVVSAVIALPLIPASSLQGSAVMALNPDQGETVGWPRFVRTIDGVWRSIPPARRAGTAIFTSNYGEAAAIDLLGHDRGLPRAYSGHNGFSEWGMPAAGDHSVLLVGYDDARDAAPYFVDCSKAATIDDGVGLDNDEQGLPVLVCHVSQSWSSSWSRLRHYD